LYKLR